MADLRARIARECYRQLYPGPIGTPDSQRTSASDQLERDKAYVTWDTNRAGFAPTAICMNLADAIVRLILTPEPPKGRS